MKTVTRYKNRKLYDNDKSKYLTHKDLLEMDKESVVVIDHETKEDITTEILFQAFVLNADKHQMESVLNYIGI